MGVVIGRHAPVIRHAGDDARTGLPVDQTHHDGRHDRHECDESHRESRLPHGQDACERERHANEGEVDEDAERDEEHALGVGEEPVGVGRRDGRVGRGRTLRADDAPVREDHARKNDRLRQHGKEHDADALVGPAVDVAHEIHVHGHLVGHGRVEDETHHQGRENDGDVQRLPAERHGSGHVLLRDDRRAEVALRLPAALALEGDDLRAVVQHEPERDAQEHEERDDEHDHHRTLDACCRETRDERSHGSREHGHDDRVTHLVSPDARVGLRRDGNGHGKALPRTLNPGHHHAEYPRERKQCDRHHEKRHRLN